MEAQPMQQPQPMAPMPPPAPPEKDKSWMPVVGGILILIGGLFEILWGAALIWSVGALDSLMAFDIEGMEMIEDWLNICGAFFIIFGLIGLLGGIFAVMRKAFGLAIVGGVFALPGWFIPALIGLILVAVSKKEFK